MTPITDIYNTPPLKPVKILLVDDRQENLLALEVMLSNKNYDLVKATSGKEALKILMDEQDFALILIDVLMPIMDGFETAELIRQSKKLKSVPIIFLTAEIDAADNIFKGYQAGAVDYIFKPLSAEILNAKVTVFVDLYRKNNELLIRDKTLNALNSELEKNIQHLKENEELLKKSNERFLKIFAKNPVGMTFSDIKTNKIAYANDLFLTLFGYSREEIIGRTSAELKLVSAEEGARLLALILNYLKEKRTPAELQLLSIEEKEQLLVDLNIAMDKKGFEVEYTRKNGELFFASIWYEIIEVDGEKYTITSYQDITERKKNEEILNKRTQQLIEAQQLAHIGSWEWNIATNKIEWSDELYRIYGIQSHVLESNYEN
ncbi:MAG TPA: response regulator, partial [Hanamia sp.]